MVMRLDGVKGMLLGLLLSVALSGCGGGGSSGGGSSSGPPQPNQWTLWFSPGVALSAGPSFNFPAWTSGSCHGATGFMQTCPSVHYLVNKGGPLSVGKTMTVTFTITGNNPQWNFLNIEQDGNQGPPGCTSPASISLYFQDSGDDWSGTGQYAFYRWYTVNVMPLAIGTYTFSVSLVADNWLSVGGGMGSAQPAAFASALGKASVVGMTFGGGCFAGHGVDLLGGSATFKLDSFTVQ